MKYFENNIVTIEYLSDINAGQGIWKGHALKDQYKEGMMKALELIKEKKVERWIADLTDLGVISGENQKWTNEVWFPQVLQAGLKRMAIVVSKDVLCNMATKNTMSKVADNVYSKYLDSRADAKAWVVAKDAEAA
jgi:hypothetical protein